jgi:drug/metabolite transporter (DMT)-like permease
MNRNWQITEKIIAGVLITWGCILFFEGAYALYNLFQILLQNLKWEQISLFKSFKIFHLQILLPLTTISGGIFLLIGRKIGWILSLIASLVSAGIYLIPYDKVFEKEDYKNSEFILFVSCIAIFFLAISIVLALKPFRNKYKPTKTNWLIISVVVFLIFADQFLAYVFSSSILELMQHK